MSGPHLTWFGLYWIGWVLAFLGPELYWLWVNPVNTLSEDTWGLEQLSLAHPLNFAAWTPGHWVIALVVWLLFAWLSVHIPFGWLR